MSASRSGDRRLVVDRFEGDVAVVELDDGATADLPRWILPPDAREGSVLLLRAGAGAVHIALDAEATRDASRAAREQLDRLRERDPGGDLEL